MVYDDENRVLVQERAGTAWDGIAFPGGHVEGDESFTESVVREVFEETGYHIESPKLCGIKHFRAKQGFRYVILLYKTNRFHGELCSSDEGRAFWIKRSEMQSYTLAHDMGKLMELFDSSEKSEFIYTKNGSCKIF